jgi:hypothetical protein
MLKTVVYWQVLLLVKYIFITGGVLSGLGKASLDRKRGKPRPQF